MKLKALILFALIAAFNTAAQAQDPVEDACKSYNKRDYAGCLKKLDSLPAKAKEPKSGYYRALTLQALHRYSEARREYQKVASQNKDKRLAALSRQGLAGLASMPKQSSLISSTIGATGKNLNTNSVIEQKPFVDKNWKLLKAGDSVDEGTRYEGLPPEWTWVKTSNGCGRH